MVSNILSKNNKQQTIVSADVVILFLVQSVNEQQFLLSLNIIYNNLSTFWFFVDSR
jgi:hypothetical protein